MHPLVPGDTIGVISPASVVDEQVVARFRELAKLHGFRTKVFGHAGEAYGRLAADDLARVHHLQAAFADDEVNAVICSRGGYGSGRLLDLIDVGAIRSKIFVGYSDITNLLCHLRAKAGIIPFHGPMAADLTDKANEATSEWLFSMLRGERLDYVLEREDFIPIRTGVARGPLVGGNITILESLLGTDSLQIPEGAVLLLEDVNEFMYGFDRALVHLKRAGVFDRVSGIVFADLKIRDQATRDNSLGMLVEEVIDYHFSAFDGPIALGLPCGHTERQLTVPIGAKTTFYVAENRLSLEFENFWRADAQGTMAA